MGISTWECILSRNCNSSDNACDSYVSDFIALFLMALSGVIGRYFAPITLFRGLKHLFSLMFFNWRYRRYRVINTFAFGGFSCFCSTGLYNTHCWFAGETAP
jgi:hypothetical protein